MWYNKLMNSQEKDFKYFVEHRDELFKEFPHQFIVIKNGKVIGSYDDQVSAFTETTRVEEPGTFIVQYSSPEVVDTQIFHTRVLKAN